MSAFRSCSSSTQTTNRAQLSAPALSHQNTCIRFLLFASFRMPYKQQKSEQVCSLETPHSPEASHLSESCFVCTGTIAVHQGKHMPRTRHSPVSLSEAQLSYRTSSSFNLRRVSKSQGRQVLLTAVSGHF